MPRSLLARRQPDSIREFRAAARQRFQDGEAARASGRRTAAIYLWGYAGEMTLKAAYFAADGFAPAQIITRTDLSQAVARGRALGIYWPAQGWGHNIRAWAELLVAVRITTPGLAYPSPTLGVEVQQRGALLGALWSEQLRYHKNVAYLYEVSQVHEAVEWLLAHSREL